MSHYVHKCYKKGERPNKLVFFIHGYNGSAEDIDYAAQMLLAKLDNVCLVLPEATDVCEKNPEKKQWFSLRQFDPQDLRRNAQTSALQVVDIYNHYGEDMLKVAKNLNQMLDDLQQEYQIGDDKTYIMGFSQGAMLAIFTSLIRKNPVKACFALSGIVAGKDELAKNILSHPKVFMFHGKYDLSVQYKTLDFSLNWLKEHNVFVTDFRYDGLAHRMIDEEMDIIAKEILAE